MNPDYLHKTLKALSVRRPIFHSEADFQHELALELNQAGWACRLEVPIEISLKGERVKAEIDLVARSEKEGVSTAIELKYVSSKLLASFNGEEFNLAQNWGVNLSRFDCLADWQRVASIVDSGFVQRGFAVFMTNCEDAWLRDISNVKNPPMAKEMSIHEGRDFKKDASLDWFPEAPKVGSVSGKRLHPYAPIVCPESCVCSWTDYSRVSDGKNGRFRYLILEGRFQEANNVL
jgi:hypothetical protein